MDHDNKNYTTEHTLLNTDVSSVFVVRNSKKRPFIETFEHTSVNFTQKNLGTILGFFIVRDDTVDSENIVNFLASEVKKRYFAPTDKSVEDKFESTLHHVNRVLEEIANVGNVTWLGTIEGAVCVINNTTIHFSVTGNAHILLLRDNILMDISEGLASDEAANYPLKTFVDISSGDIAPHDKIIITSQELLDLISFEELQKNAVRMGQKNFIQFIETALTNECAIASATIIDIAEAKNAHHTPQVAEPKELPSNFFGANAYEQDTVSTQDNLEDESLIDVDSLNLDKDDTPSEYTDPRTGHMYIQGNDEILPEPTIIETLQEKMYDFFETIKIFTQKNWRTLSKKISGFTNHTKSDDTDSVTLIDDENAHITNTSAFKEKAIKKTKIYFYRVCAISKDSAKKTAIYCVDTFVKIRELKNPIAQKSSHTNHPINTPNTSTEKSPRIFPSINHITHLWHSMSSATRISAIGIVAFMIFVPLIFAFFTRNAQPTPSEESTSTEDSTQTEELVTEQTNYNTIVDPSMLYESNDTLRVTILQGVPFVIEKKAITMFDDTQEHFPLSSDAGTITNITPMEDLNMLFFITDQDKIYTFSPITKKYEEQKSFPQFDHTQISAISTYLTYLYILNDTMITRHTRIENGFDDGKKWLDNSFDFTQATDMAINEDIYTIHKNTITKFAEGKATNYIQDATIIAPHYMYATEDTEFIWILDTENTTLYKTAKNDGKIRDTFVHSDFNTGTSLVVDEKQNIALISTPEKTLQFSLTQ